ncbi:MAG TPA: hypothetical protein VGL98_11100 [Gammaproteobacteria bacterium]
MTVPFVASGAVVIANLERSHGAEPLTWRAPHLFTNGAPLTSFAPLVAAGIRQSAAAALVAIDAVTTVWLAAVGS